MICGKEAELKREGVHLEFVAENRAYMPFYKQSWHAFRTKEYKYIIVGSKPFALYNLQDDPYEMDNLINQPKYKEIQEQLHAQMK